MLFARQDISRDLLFVIGCQEGQIVCAAREDLEPKFAHFIAGLSAESNPFRRCVRILWIVSGVIILVAHEESSALGQKDRSCVFVIALPIEIPLLNKQETLSDAIGQYRDPLHFFAEIMGVRKNSQQ